MESEKNISRLKIIRMDIYKFPRKMEYSITVFTLHEELIA